MQGYLTRCREYNKLFDKEQIETIFSNIEEVFRFQKDFLSELEARVKPDHMTDSLIGEVFVLNVSFLITVLPDPYNICCLLQQHEFKVYSQYCNNHPHAVGEMSYLQENEQYCFFFEVS